MTVVEGNSTGLRVYKVVKESNLLSIVSKGWLTLQDCGTEQWKIGLRENLSDAIERESKCGGLVSKDTHIVLEIVFSPVGIAYYTTQCQGSIYDFQPTLRKMSYRRDTTDWKVWHFQGELPLEAHDEQGNLLVTSRIMEIV